MQILVIGHPGIQGDSEAELGPSLRRFCLHPSTFKCFPSYSWPRCKDSGKESGGIDYRNDLNMVSCLLSRGRLLVPRLSTVLRPQICFKSESAKEAFRKIFPRMGAGKLKARYDANSYGQTVGPEYPFDIEKTPEGKLKREKSKGTMGSVTVEEIVDILRSNGGENIKLAKLHQDLHYADHFVIVSAKNTEHLKSMTQELASKV